MIGIARAIGMSLDEFWRCTPWQFSASVRGWIDVHGAKKTEPPTESEVDEMMQEHGFK